MKLVKQDLGKVAITVDKYYWNATKAYDRLVITEVMGVGCYISRKPVPVGIQYDNREYWIRISNLSGGEGSTVNLVTEFGDSVELAIAQKTITDRFDSTDESIAGTLREAKGYTNASLEGVYDRILEVEDNLSHDINQNSGEISQLWQFANTTQPVVAWLNTTVNKHTEQLDGVNTDIEKLKLVDTTLNDNIAHLTLTVEDLTNNVNKAYVTLFPYQCKVLYIGGVMTRNNNGVTINALRNRLKRIESANFYRVVVDNLTGSVLAGYANGTTHLPDGFPEISKYDLIVVQTDTFDEVVGSTSDFPQTYNVDRLYANTVYGQYMYFADKLRDINQDVAIVFVAAPNIEHTDKEAGYKPYAIKEVAELSGSMYVNPFKFRYSSEWTDTITVAGEPKTILGDTSLFAIKLFVYWGQSIANKILLDNLIV